MPIGTPSVPYRLPGSQMERWVDIYTRLGVERILFLGSEVNDGIANSLVAQMLYLDSEDSSKPIYLYINSPGGSVTAGLAIYDTISTSKARWSPSASVSPHPWVPSSWQRAPKANGLPSPIAES